MTTDTPATRARWAQILSDVFSPLLTPTYAMIMAMWLTPMRVLPESTRLMATAIVAVLTAVIPCLAIVVLMRLHRISDRAISDRRQRLVPYSVAVVCYLAAAWTMHRFGAPAWLPLFFLGGGLATAIDTAINFRWKISAHTTGIGGCAGMMAWFALSGFGDPAALIWLSALIVLGGAIGTARLALERHTFAQVIAGFIVGTGAVLSMMCLSYL